jgi:hypothetical protein
MSAKSKRKKTYKFSRNVEKKINNFKKKLALTRIKIKPLKSYTRIRQIIIISILLPAKRLALPGGGNGGGIGNWCDCCWPGYIHDLIGWIGVL